MYILKIISCSLKISNRFEVDLDQLFGTDFDEIVSFVPGILCPLYCYCKRWGDGMGGGWLIHIRVWVGGQGVGFIL